MLIYNVTIHIENDVAEEFLRWMQEEHIAEVLATNLFSKAVFVKVHADDESEGQSFACQYYCDSQEKLQTYYNSFAPKLRQKGLEKFGTKMIGFRTELNVLHEFVV